MRELKWKDKEGFPRVTQQANDGVNGNSGGLLCFYASNISSASIAPDSCSAHPCPGPVFQDTGLGVKYLANQLESYFGDLNMRGAGVA